jgi:hypothetical protein
LGERRNNATKGGGHGGGSQRINLDRDKSAFMEVHGKARSGGEIIKDFLKISHVL